MNAAWHRTHPMPKKATLDERVRWHVEHARTCACRGIPKSVLRELKSVGDDHRPFVDKASAPTKPELLGALGRAGPLWTRLRDDLSSELAPLIVDWTYAGRAHGWALRLKQKRRSVLYMSPRRGFFIAAFALGEQACRAAQEGGLPERVLHLIDGAPRYPEGRGVRLEVRSRRDLALVMKLAVIKLAN